MESKENKSFHVLVIEDDRGILKLYEKYLSDQGYQFDYAVTGGEGIIKLQTEKYDLICLDLMLPDMNGIQFIEKMKARLEWTPVIIITGNPTLDSTIEALNAGIVTEYIVKPFESKEFVLTIRKALDKTKLAIENKRLLKRLETANLALTERVEQLEQFAKEAVSYKSELDRMQDYIKELEKRLGI